MRNFYDHTKTTGGLSPVDLAAVDQYEIATRAYMAGLHDFDGKLTAAQQRDIFGFAIFGRCSVQIDLDGVCCFRVWKWTTCGTDSISTQLTAAEVAQNVREGRLALCG